MVLVCGSHKHKIQVVFYRVTGRVCEKKQTNTEADMNSL